MFQSPAEEAVIYKVSIKVNEPDATVILMRFAERFYLYEKDPISKCY